MASIKDISKELGLGVSTISMALNNNPKISKKTRELVQSKARELKYTKNGAAVDLQKRKTNLILFVLNDASRTFFSRVIRELQNDVSEAGYDLIISTTYGGHTGAAERYIKERRADAVIVYTKTIPDELLNECASEEFPIFVLGHNAYIDNEYVRSYQYLDNGKENLISADFLIGQGHKRIGFVKGFHESYGTINTLKKFNNSMNSNNLEVNDSMIFDANGNSELDGYRVVKEDIYKRYKEFDALIFTNDDIAIGALRAFAELGVKVPDEISVIGAHNIPQSAISNPPLTTFSSDLDYENYYKDFVDLVISYVEGRDASVYEKKLSQYHAVDYIIERESVKSKIKSK